MCLIIDKKRCPIGYRIARRDIPCYKILLETHSGIFVTPCIGESVDIKKGIEADNFQTKPINKLRIDKGVHSYTNLASAYRFKKSLYISLDKFIYSSVKVLKGYIPKGTKYWIGMWDELCSERIVFAEK